MADCRLLPAAEADLQAVWRYSVERWSALQAERYLNILFDCLEEIGANPELGLSVGWIRPGYRRRLVASHLVFYRIAQDRVPEIVRILHERMDVDDLLRT